MTTTTDNATTIPNPPRLLRRRTTAIAFASTFALVLTAVPFASAQASGAVPGSASAQAVAVSSPMKANKKSTTVKLRSKGRTRLRVDVNPNKRAWNYRVKIQKRVAGRWKVVRTTRTKGVSDTRTVKFSKKGWYRAVVPAQRGFKRDTSPRVRLRGKAPAAPQTTVAQANALRAARGYLDTMAFSKQGLIDQLSSQYADGYSIKDATWAVARVGANWNKQAVRAAKSYLEIMPFSRSGLIDQLSSEYGDQYTVAQATYAANAVGL